MNGSKENKLASPTAGRMNKVYGLPGVTITRRALSNVVFSEDMEFEPESERSPKVASKLNKSDGTQPKIQSFLETLPKAKDPKGGEPRSCTWARRMLDVVSSDSDFGRDHEVKRSLKTSSKVKRSLKTASKAQTKKLLKLLKGMTSKSSKEKGERKRPRVYSGEAKEAIVNLNKEVGGDKDKDKEAGGDAKEAGGDAKEAGGDKDKEAGGDANEAGGDKDKEAGGDAKLDQVKKEQNQVETDVICEFDSRAPYKESQLTADMKKYGETEQEIGKLEQILLRRKKENEGLAKKIAKKLGDRLASGGGVA